jgi:FkbM family methyltransferase
VKSFRELLGYKSLKRVLPGPLLLREMAWRYWMYGEREVRILKTLIRPGSGTIDVGAASGLYAYHLSRYSKDVFAYEPNPEWTEWLRSAVPANVSVFEVALSNRPGRAILSIPPPSLDDQSGDFSLRCPEAASIEKAFSEVPCDRIEVKTACLDEYSHRDISFIKIDVEGHELAVLDGADETIRANRPLLLVEIIQQHIKRDIYDEFAAIEMRDYRGMFFLNGRLNPLEQFRREVHQPSVDFANKPETYVMNFLFVPAERARQYL